MPPAFSERWGTGRLAIQYSYYHTYLPCTAACSCRERTQATAHLIFCIAYSCNLKRKVPSPLKRMKDSDWSLCPSPYLGLDLIKWEYTPEGRGTFIQKTRYIIMLQRKFRRLQGRKKVESSLRKILRTHITPPDLIPEITRFITG